MPDDLEGPPESSFTENDMSNAYEADPFGFSSSSDSKIPFSSESIVRPNLIKGRQVENLTRGGQPEFSFPGGGKFYP